MERIDGARAKNFQPRFQNTAGRSAIRHVTAKPQLDQLNASAQRVPKANSDAQTQTPTSRHDSVLNRPLFSTILLADSSRYKYYGWNVSLPLNNWI